MGELDIKEIWQTQKLSTPDLHEDELERMLRQQSQSVVDRLKKTTRIEHVGNIAVSIGLILYFLIQSEYSVAAVLSVVLGLSVWYYKNLYNKLEAIQPTSDVHVYLLQVREKLGDFIWKYQVALVILFTIAFAIGFYVAIKDKPMEDRFVEPATYLRIGIVYISTLAICFLLVFLLYGTKARKIKRLLREIES